MFNTYAPLHGLARSSHSIPSTDEEKTGEVQRVTATPMSSNGYPARFNDSCCCKSRKPREKPGDQAVTRNLVVLPYVYAKRATEKITREVNQHNIEVTHKRVHTVGSFF